MKSSSASTSLTTPGVICRTPCAVGRRAQNELEDLGGALDDRLRVERRRLELDLGRTDYEGLIGHQLSNPRPRRSSVRSQRPRRPAFRSAASRRLRVSWITPKRNGSGGNGNGFERT
jgi:hypothetical protein